MRILIITQWFEPEPFLKNISFLNKLVEKGHEIQVLTGFPNYPTGKLYPGYRIRFYQIEQMGSIPVIRVPLYPSHDNSVFKRISNYLSFAFSASILGPWLLKKPDVIYAYNPPPTVYLPACILKLLYRVPLVYDIQDFFPDTLAATDMFKSKLGFKLVDIYCRLLYRAANKIVVLCPGFKKKLIGKGVPEEKIEIIYNWADEKNLQSKQDNVNLPEVLSKQESFKVLFAGNMGKAQALKTILKAAEILKESSAYIKFIFLGNGVEAEYLKQQSIDMNLPNVHFFPAVPSSQVGYYLSAADILLVHLKKDPLFRITVPSKIQAYLAAGKPILCAVPGDASDLVKQAGAGLECPSEDPERMAETVLAFSKMTSEQLGQMGKNGQAFYQENISLKVGATQFEKLFRELHAQKNV